MNGLPQWSRSDTRRYFGVRCCKCRAPILFADDRQTVEENAPPAVERLVLTCTANRCGHRADYTKSQFLRFERSVDKSVKATRMADDKQRRPRKRRA